MHWSVLLVLPLLFGLGETAHKCVWARGKVECKKNPDEVLRTEIRMYDRDGGKTFGWLDKDDLMGLTVPEPDGSFVLDGCGDDHDWFPWVKNNPEPYLTIFHYCKNPEGDGEEVRYQEFSVFSPEIYRPTTFVLDD